MGIARWHLDVFQCFRVLNIEKPQMSYYIKLIKTIWIKAKKYMGEMKTTDNREWTDLLCSTV